MASVFICQVVGVDKCCLDEKDIKQARRRLSVMSDNKLVEGFDSVNLDGEEEVCYKTVLLYRL